MPNSSQERVLKVPCDAQPSAKQTVDAASVAVLEPTGWTLPDPESAPTGSDIVERYRAPLAALPQIAPFIRLRTRVTAIARRAHDKMKTPGRDEAPFPCG